MQHLKTLFVLLPLILHEGWAAPTVGSDIALSHSTRNIARRVDYHAAGRDVLADKEKVKKRLECSYDMANHSQEAS